MKNKEIEKLVNLVNSKIQVLNKIKLEIERLLQVLDNRQVILDRWSEQFISNTRVKLLNKNNLIDIPEDEKEEIKKQIGEELYLEFEQILENSIKEYLENNTDISIHIFKTVISKIEETIDDLEKAKISLRKDDISAAQKNKDFVLKRVFPIIGGSTLIGLDIVFKSWPTIVAGALAIVRGIE